MSDLLEQYLRPIRDSNDWFFRRSKELPLATGAREKYEADGTAKGLPGFSFVYFLDQTSDVYRDLSSFHAHLKRCAEQRGIAGKLALLPPATFHLTLADGVVWPDEQAKLGIRGKTREVFAAIRTRGMQVAHLKVAGVGISAGVSIVAWCVPRSEADLQRLHDLLRELQTLNRWNNQVCRRDPEGFLGHITLAYFTDGLSTEDYSGLLDCLRPYEQWTSGTLAVDRVELRYFRDIQQWSAGLETVDLR